MFTHKSGFLAYLALAALFCVAMPARLRAQAGSGELTGEVRDPSTALVAGARVTLTQNDTHLTFSSVTSDGGIYLFSALKPGLYQLAVQAQGFKRFVRQEIRVATAERLNVNVDLQIGSAQESVTVTGDAPPLRTESPTMAQSVKTETIVALPLNGRNFVPLVGLTAGVALPPGQVLPRLNGGRPRTNEYLYDGISVLQPEPGQVAFYPIIDAIQEFNVQTNVPSAEFGRFNGGVINLTTRSGTSDYHGTLFEFLRNEALNARNLFQPATPANPNKPEYRRNQFGGVFGGPIVRDHTFFFVDYQGTRQAIAKTVTSTVPSLAEHNGDFSASLGAVIAGAGNTLDTAGNTIPIRKGMIFRPTDHLAYAGNVIPVNTFDPVAAALLSRFPNPTSSGSSNNYTRTANEPDQQDQFDIRLDHRFSDRDQMFGRYSYFRDNTSPVTALPDGSGAAAAGSLATAPQLSIGQSFASNYQHTFSSNLLNEVRFGYTRRSIDRKALLLSAPPSQSLSLPGLPSNAAFNNELPTFVLSGYQSVSTSPTLGPPSSVDSLFRTDTVEIADTVSWLHGRHAFKFGGDFRFFRLDVIQPPSPTGSFTFSTLFTDKNGVTGTGNVLASFLTGAVQKFSIDLQQNKLRPRAWFQEWFAQDTWKLTQRLTLSGGARWTLNFPSTEADNQGSLFNFQTQQLDYFGQNGFRRSARKLHWGELAPRVGLAYMLTSKTVIRSGYGMSYFDMSGITTPFTNPQFPFVQTVQQSNLTNTTPAFFLGGGPNVQPIPLTANAGLGQSVYSADYNLGSGYAQQWNLAVQREVTPNLSFEVAYTGSKVTHIGVPDYNINQLTAAQLALGSTLTTKVANPFFGQIPASSPLGAATITNAQLMLPFPRFQNVILFRNNVGNTSYQGLYTKVEKRFSHGLTFMGSFTFSKLLDDASSVFDATIGTGLVSNFPVADGFNRSLERDVSSGDIPKVLVMSYTYDLPVGPGHALHPRGALGKFANGWQILGDVSVQSGLPLAIAQGTNNNSFAGFATQRPNCLGNPNLPGSQRSTAQFFNTAMFQTAPQFVIGTCSRNPVRGPAYRNADVAFAKRTPLKEAKSLDFRVEIFNLTNTPLLGNPNTTVGNAAFGTITSAGDPRVVQLALKLNF